MKSLLVSLVAISCFLHAQDMPSLEEYLETHNVIMTEGYMIASQKQGVNALLSLYPDIESVLEIGLNAGHSAENFFQTCPKLKKFVSFDINSHEYTKVAVEYLSQKYPDAFQFIPGNSRKTVPAYTIVYPNAKFDLIYIDGDHSYSGAVRDILNCKSLANSKTILLIDDYSPEMEVKKAVDDMVSRGIIVLEDIYHAEDRCWVKAYYR